MDLIDTRYEVENGLAWITIDRPDRMNAFRARTVDELIGCFSRAWSSTEVGVICLTGAGDRAFCAGGDQKQRAETGNYGESESGRFEVEAFRHACRIWTLILEISVYMAQFPSVAVAQTRPGSEASTANILPPTL